MLVPDTVDDSFFSAADEKEGKKAGKSKDDFFKSAKEEGVATSDARKEIQSSVDKGIKVGAKADYLKARFAIRNGDKPHAMAF